MSEVEKLKNRIKELEVEVRELKEKINKQEAGTIKARGRRAKFKSHDIAAMKWYRINNKSYREIAEMYKCSVATVHKLINENK